ncbi:MFS transporter [Morganella morganii]|uniref:MFS transporter n=1 Tax=Morganella morganii TaxID=582 RepID=UPI000D1E3288|nr:MFS transporter [Morganella morganii]HAE78176.1 MFS transporter [Morganella sp. (in: enterobacteria)]QXO44437.1 MFS transporter [Morganella morganii]QXO44710.1 MFS transporter [Morganella morganii]QXO51827.1 MFS transporter [Morganella morganii]QXO55692.1 MFS transporter [Morganella morganii]
MLIYRAIFERKSRAINICFFFNALGSGLLMPLALLYFAGKTLSEKEILYLGTIKFWSFSLAYFFIIPLISRFDSKKTIIFSLFFKLLSLLFLFTGQTFYICGLVMLVNGIATSVFSVAAKYYIKATSQNISESFSVRMTLNNTGAAIAPVLITLFVFFSLPFAYALLILTGIFTCGIVFSAGLRSCPGKPESHFYFFHFTDLTGRDTVLISVTSIIFAMLYYSFEVIVPLELIQSGNEHLIGPVLLFNTLVIIAGQLPVYRYFTVKWGIITSLMTTTGLCILLFVPWFSGIAELSGLLLIVLGVTLLEMFYGAGIDTLITSADSPRKIAILDGISGISLAIGAAMTAAVYSDSVLFLPLVITLYLLVAGILGSQKRKGYL